MCPQQTDLTGLGMSPMQAIELGNQPTSLTAAGSTQATAAAILSRLVNMTATGADGIILPSNALIGSPYWVFNSSGSTGKVYCAVGDTMNTVSNSSLSVTTLKLAVFIKHSKGNWSSIQSN